MNPWIMFLLIVIAITAMLFIHDITINNSNNNNKNTTMKPKSKESQKLHNIIEFLLKQIYLSYRDYADESSSKDNIYYLTIGDNQIKIFKNIKDVDIFNTELYMFSNNNKPISAYEIMDMIFDKLRNPIEIEEKKFQRLNKLQINQKVQEKLDNKKYVKKCIKAGICPECGSKLKTRVIDDEFSYMKITKCPQDKKHYYKRKFMDDDMMDDDWHD